VASKHIQKSKHYAESVYKKAEDMDYKPAEKEAEQLTSGL
jgi:hypothetical protein